MATKSSIHIKPCNSHQAGHTTERTASICVISGVQVYVVPELSTDNEQWINPDFGTPELQTHYDNIKPNGSRKRPDVPCRKRKGTQRERMERLSRWRDAHPSVKVLLIRPDTHWLMYANSVKSAKRAQGITPPEFSCIKTKGHWLNGSAGSRKTRRASKSSNRWFKPNYHAHVVFDWMNHETGKSRKLNDEDMAAMQTLALIFS